MGSLIFFESAERARGSYTHMHDDSEYFDTPALPLGVRLVLSVIAGVGGAVVQLLAAALRSNAD